MANLSALFGKKPDAPTATDKPDSPAPQPNQRMEEAPATQDGPVETAMPPRKGLGFLGKASGPAASTPAAGTPSDSSKPSTPTKPKLAGLSLGKATPPVAPESAKAAVEEGIINLDDLMNDESEAPAAPAPRRYPDEIEATAPVRPIPEDASEQMLKFVKLIDSVYDMQFDKELLGNVIRSIMIELQSNPIYISKDWKKSLVQPDDIRLWIRNMREVMGLNKIVKQEKKAKRGSSKKQMDSNEMLDDLSSLGFTMEL